MDEWGVASAERWMHCWESASFLRHCTAFWVDFWVIP